MCRTWPHLVDILERNDVVEVYNIDEQLADLALQMTRIGMPVNSGRRQEIGDRLKVLREKALTELQVYTEGEHRATFIDWVASFFAKKARKGEPVDGSIVVGPTRAADELAEAQAALKEWRAYRKACAPEELAEIASVDAQILELEAAVKIAKADVRNAQFIGDEMDGLAYTADRAYEVRMAIRRQQFLLALEKKGVNYGAKVQQSAILRTAGVPLLKVTEKTGLPKIDKEVLESFGRHAAAKALLSFILVNSTINVYIEGEKRAGGSSKSEPIMVTEDGYLHPQWSIHKISGRWSSSPATQNWSKRAGGGAENLREMIEAPEGYLFVGADEKQLEARLIGAMSGCKFMLDIFQRGGDIHGALAGVGFPREWPRLNSIFKEHKSQSKCHCLDCQMRDKIRDITKRLEYGFIYGGKAQTLWESVAKEFEWFTIRQTEEFIRQCNLTMPEVLRWRDQTYKEAIENGGIRSPILGRWQFFPLGRVDPTVAYNFKAQAGAADLWALGALNFCAKWDQYDVDARIIHNGHDSVLILCREELAPQVEQDVYTCWNCEWNGVPFEMEAKIGKRWSET